MLSVSLGLAGSGHQQSVHLEKELDFITLARTWSHRAAGLDAALVVPLSSPLQRPCGSSDWGTNVVHRALESLGEWLL